MQIITTSDGSNTIYLPGINEQYHSVNGAVTESEYVYIDKGFKFIKKKYPKVFEVGFGTGLNCLLTAIEAEKKKVDTLYITIEKFPLSQTITQQLNYGKIISKEALILFEKIHSSPWEKVIEISDYFQLKKINADLISFDFKQNEKFDMIYFDAFGPDKQPEMWTPEIFEKIHSITSENGVLVTYSAKGEVRRQLTTCGFVMERIPGPPGKKQMLRGINKKSTN